MSGDEMPRDSVVLQLVRSHDEKHENGHKRLRVDWREHDERLDQLETAWRSIDLRVASLASAPQDLSKSTLPSKVVVAVVVAAIGVVVSIWGMRSDIRDISTRMAAQVALDDNKQKLADDRAAANKAAVESIGRKMELQQIQIQELREAVLGQRRSR